MARDPAYVAGYRTGYHRGERDADGSNPYQDGYTTGSGDRQEDDDYARTVQARAQRLHGMHGSGADAGS